MRNWARIIIGDSRNMGEISDNSIDLIITSPPYWHIKDYGIPGQIGYGQSLHEYLIDLYRVWSEAHRVLKPGRRLCINIGDQFARSTIYGRYKIIPLHAELIAQCESLGFDYMGAIIWQKKTTLRTTGGAPVMGSYPYPPNGMIEIDYEFILIFKKPGKSPKVPSALKHQSQLHKEEWKEYFSGHWTFPGVRQQEHEAMFPEELPKRLIKMFSFVNDTVLDPFLGSGTTAKVALGLQRNAIGYEINPAFVETIKSKIGITESSLFAPSVQIEKQQEVVSPKPVSYTPRIQNATPQLDPQKWESQQPTLHKVVRVLSEDTVELDSGLRVRFLGIVISDRKKAMEYLKSRILKKPVLLKFASPNSHSGELKTDDQKVEAYVFLKNKIFINAYLIKAGWAKADRGVEHPYKQKFVQLEKEHQ